MVRVFPKWLLSFWSLSVLCCAHAYKSPPSSFTNFSFQKKLENPSQKLKDSVESDYHFLIGETYSMKGDHKKASQMFQKSLEEKKSLFVSLRLAQEYIAAQLFNEALLILEQVLELEPESDKGLLLLGNIYFENKMYKKALLTYEKLLEYHSLHKRGLTVYGLALSKTKGSKMALKHFGNLLKNPRLKEEYHLYHYYRGLLTLGRGEKYHRVSHKDFRSCLNLSPSYMPCAQALSQLYAKEGWVQKRKRLLENFLKKNSAEDIVGQELLSLYLESEDLEEAIQLLTQMLDVYPANAGLLAQKSFLLFTLKRYREALVEFEKLITVYDNKDQIRYYMGVSYLELNQPQNAKMIFQNISKDSNFKSKALFQASYFHKEKGDIGLALSMFENSFDRVKKTPELYIAYVSLLDEGKQYNRVIELMLEALQKFPVDSDIHFFIGHAYAKVGRFQDMVRHMDFILRSEENNVKALNYLAYSYAERGEKLKEAESMALKALKKRS